ncbi:methionine synthase reductase-like [Ciona intestinalis]
MNNGTKNKITVLYGSQTGQAEEIAKQIHEDAVFGGYDAEVFCLKEEGKKFDIKEIKCAVFVCSTTGDGDPPENARKFLRTISRKTLPNDHLSNLYYTLLGLGDSNYSTFCGGPKKLDKVLSLHGANKFYEAGFADDGTDMELVVEPWLDGLWPALKSYFSKDKSHITSESSEIINNNLNVVPNNESALNSNAEPVTSVTDISEKVANIEITENVEKIETTLLPDSILWKKSPLSASNLTLPPLFPIHLEASPTNEEKVDTYQNNFPFPVACGDVTNAHVRSARVLTRHDAVKRAIEAEFDVTTEYKAGDVIAVCCYNNKLDVDWLIERLGLTETADQKMKMKVSSVAVKKKEVPPYIPEVFTIREIFTSCLEIRSVIKKTLIRCLVECTSNLDEKRRLEELCSRQGGGEYMDVIRGNMISVLDILATFPSCKPTFETLVQHLPRLQPRRYSIARYSSNYVSIVFNVVRFERDSNHLSPRSGVCTGYLEQLLQPMIEQRETEILLNIKIFPTKSNGFSPPPNLRNNLVMIGPGTGVAPFIGFLQQRQERLATDTEAPGCAWLFYGCRHKERDFLFQDELDKFKRENVLTKFCVAFSRDERAAGGAKYVQDSIKTNGEEIISLLLDSDTVFYVCGDARNMAKDVRTCMVGLIAKYTGCDVESALCKFNEIVSEKRYKEDIWT